MANASNLIIKLAICFLLYLNILIFHLASAVLLLSLNIVLISLTNFSQSQIFYSSSIWSNFFWTQMLVMPSLRWARIAVILLFVVMTLLFLKNNCIPLYQSSNFVLSLSNYPKFRTMLLSMTDDYLFVVYYWCQCY